jgi:hypothetical protein
VTTRTPTNKEVQALVEYSLRRNMAAAMFRPMEHQEPFFRNYAREYLLRGGVRAGKSACAAMKFALTAMDLDVTYNDGTSHSIRQPWQKGKCLRMWVIGYDSKHIGQTIYRLLFKPGLFKIIKDLNTGLYRAFRPWEEEDKKREKEAKPSPALIPSRYIKPNTWDWENKKGKEFKSVVIRDPISGEDLAEIYAFSSKADPKAGDPVDMIWIDEAIENPSHYEEWKSRLFDVRGSLIWSSWPNVQNDALAKLTERALEESKKENPLVRETVISLSANKTIDKETLNEALGMFASPEERRARDKGEYVTDLLRMYPIFDEYQHQAVLDGDPDRVSEILRKNGGIPPADWTRELIIDPGTQHPAALFVAIPPPELIYPGTETFVVYDELAGDFVRQHDATKLAKKIKEKTGGLRFHRMIIDMQAGQQKQMGYEIRIVDNYREALERERVFLETGSPFFTPGSKDVGGRIGQLQQWMHVQPQSELPKLRIVRSRCPNLVKQLREYKKSCVNNYVKDDRPYPNQHIDAAVALEYWASSHPRYVRPKFAPTTGSALSYVIGLRDALRRKSSGGGQIGPQYETTK